MRYVRLDVFKIIKTHAWPWCYIQFLSVLPVSSVSTCVEQCESFRYQASEFAVLYSGDEVSDTEFKILIHCHDLKVKLVDDMRKFRKIWQLLGPRCQVILKLAVFWEPGKYQSVLNKKKIWQFYSLAHKSFFLCSFEILTWWQPKDGSTLAIWQQLKQQLIFINRPLNLWIFVEKILAFHFHRIFIYWLHGCRVAHLEAL